MCVWKVAPEDRLCRICMNYGCVDRHTPGRRNGRIMPLMREMAVGDEMSFDCEHYNAVRTAAHKLGKMFGAYFKTHKEGDRVLVKRCF